MEEKIYKQIAEIRGRIIVNLMYKASVSEEYHRNNQEELNKTVHYIANKDKWDYCGIFSKEDLIKLELLESLLK